MNDYYMNNEWFFLIIFIQLSIVCPFSPETSDAYYNEREENGQTKTKCCKKCK